MVAFDIVDYLYDRPVIIGQTIQNHRVALLDDWEPLPVGVELGREISQCRVAGISQDSQCTGRNWAVQVFADSPEHTVIPIIRLEKSAYRLILMFVFRREPKDFAPLCQVFQMGIQIIRHTCLQMVQPLYQPPDKSKGNNHSGKECRLSTRRA